MTLSVHIINGTNVIIVICEYIRIAVPRYLVNFFGSYVVQIIPENNWITFLSIIQ